jgi:hypothetical protein
MEILPFPHFRILISPSLVPPFQNGNNCMEYFGENQLNKKGKSLKKKKGNDSIYSKCYRTVM